VHFYGTVRYVRDVECRVTDASVVGREKRGFSLKFLQWHFTSPAGLKASNLWLISTVMQKSKMILVLTPRYSRSAINANARYVYNTVYSGPFIKHCPSIAKTPRHSITLVSHFRTTSQLQNTFHSSKQFSLPSSFSSQISPSKAQT
jgi:hypothetical protein